METKSDRIVRFILEHIESWENLPRLPGESIFEPKVCQLRFTPYRKQPTSATVRFLMLAVVNRLIAVEDGAALPDENTNNAMENIEINLEGDQPVIFPIVDEVKE